SPDPSTAPAQAYATLLGRLEDADRLDPAVAFAAPKAARLTAHPALARFFHGDATGIPIHTILTDVPFGAWLMALYLARYDDEASRIAARRLIALGIAAAAPTALSGWAEWSRLDHPRRRVGVVHAALNATGVLVFTASFAARSAGRHGLGAGLARLGGGVVIAGGFLGGHLAAAARTPAPTNCQGTRAVARAVRCRPCPRPRRRPPATAPRSWRVWSPRPSASPAPSRWCWPGCERSGP